MTRTQIIELPVSPSNTHQASARPQQTGAVQCAEVYVLFTSFDETLAALRVAHELADSFDGSVRLVDFRVVPLGAPVDAPTGRSPIETEAFLDRVRAEGIDVRMDVCVSRDARRAIPLVFKDHSVIVIGARRRRWPTRAERWRRELERRGHFVLIVEAGNNGAGWGAKAGRGAGDT